MDNIEDKEKSLPNVHLGKLRHIVKSFKNQPDNYELSFEFIIGSLFPTCFQNVMNYGKDCYTQGYLAGKEQNEN